MYYANSFQNLIITRNGFITRTVQQGRQQSWKEKTLVPSDFRVNTEQSCIFRVKEAVPKPWGMPWARVVWSTLFPDCQGPSAAGALGQGWQQNSLPPPSVFLTVPDLLYLFLI